MYGIGGVSHWCMVLVGCHIGVWYCWGVTLVYGIGGVSHWCVVWWGVTLVYGIGGMSQWCMVLVGCNTGVWFGGVVVSRLCNVDRK